MRRWSEGLVGASAAGLGVWWWWRLHPTSRPFAQRVWVDAPHPFVTRPRLLRALGPEPGERLLAVGVGSGWYAVPVRAALRSGLVVGLDVHHDMLQLTRRRATRAGSGTVSAVAGDACALPFADSTFDAAWMVSMLGQVADPTEALAEAARVVRPGGRVLVGELGYDPHGVFLRDLSRRAADAGLVTDRCSGRWLGYLARFIVPG